MVSADEYAAVLARLRVTEAAVAQIGTTLDERETCRELAGFLHGRLCDAVAVDVGWGAGAPGGEGGGAGGGGLERVAAAGAAGLLPDPADGAGSPSVRALDEGHPIAASARLSGGERVHLLSVPLIGPGGVRGAVLAVRSGRGFSDHEAAAVHYAARLAAVHIGHARRLAATERTALHLQRALVAEPGRPHPNLEVAGRYLPVGPRTLVGGDWFETVRLHFGRTLLVVGDVMGHGLDAAVDMNAYRATLRDVAATDLPPHRVLRQLDASVAEDGARRPATCLLVRVDPARGVAAFASAGHLPPVVFAADGTARLVDIPVGPPLGTGVGGYGLATRTMAPGDTLLLFTDGLVERRGEDIDHSLARLAALLMPPGAGPEEIADEALRRLDARHAEDDVAVLAARFRRRAAPGG